MSRHYILPLFLLLAGGILPAGSPSAAGAPKAPRTDSAYLHPAARTTPHGDGRLDRAERRELKRQAYAARLDSTVESRMYVFMPNSMEDISGGGAGLIYNQDYYVAVLGDRVEMHLPLVMGKGLAQYVKIVNFDTYDLRGYDVARTGFGWSITFETAPQGPSDKQVYTVNILVNTYTGETALNLTAGGNTMHYIGVIEQISG